MLSFAVESSFSSLSKNLKIKIYITIILLVLYGCETWPLTLREKRRLRVFESRVLRRIFGPKSEVTGEWRKLHNELNDLYSSHNIVQVIKPRRMRWAGHVAQMGERRGTYRGLVGKPEGKRQLGRHRHRWEDHMKIDLQELECGGMDWISLAQDRNRWQAIVNAVMSLRVPQNARNFLNS